MREEVIKEKINDLRKCTRMPKNEKRVLIY